MLTSQPLSFKMASVRRSSPYVRHSFASRLGETSLLVDLVTPTLLHYTQPQTIASTLYSPDSTSNNEPPPSSSNSHSLTHLPPPIHRLQHILYRWSLRRFLGPAMSDQPPLVIAQRRIDQPRWIHSARDEDHDLDFARTRKRYGIIMDLVIPYFASRTACW